MVTDTLQTRINKELLKRIDSLVKSGIYANRADVIRDAVRRFVWEKEAGSISPKGKSTEQIKKLEENCLKKKSI